jgi:hypothetical protein
MYHDADHHRIYRKASALHNVKLVRGLNTVSTTGTSSCVPYYSALTIADMNRVTSMKFADRQAEEQGTEDDRASGNA